MRKHRRSVSRIFFRGHLPLEFQFWEISAFLGHSGSET
jgi:hypothetical protein